MSVSRDDLNKLKKKNFKSLVSLFYVKSVARFATNENMFGNALIYKRNACL